jgi:hypothetical protein
VVHQTSLDTIADALGGRAAFFDACRQANSELARSFLALESSDEPLQDLCTRASINATDLVGSIMGSLIMQSNNVALMKSALSRPAVMDANIALALGDGPEAFDAQVIQFKIAGFLKGEGTQVVNLVQNVQGTGLMSFEDAAHASIESVKGGGGLAKALPTSEPSPANADTSILEGDDDG